METTHHAASRLAGALTLVFATAASCGASDDACRAGARCAPDGAALVDDAGSGREATTVLATLSVREAESLAFMREEEKLARDVYARLVRYDRSFTNIGRSEQTHMDAVLTLLTRYGLPDPAAQMNPGEFTDGDLQTLHDTLVAQGEASRLSALAVGVEIEELDLHDLAGWLADVRQADVRMVYENLARGSRNHLRTFYGKLVAAGGSYVPRHLDRVSFDAIVSSPHERP